MKQDETIDAQQLGRSTGVKDGCAVWLVLCAWGEGLVWMLRALWCITLFSVTGPDTVRSIDSSTLRTSWLPPFFEYIDVCYSRSDYAV